MIVKIEAKSGIKSGDFLCRPKSSVHSQIIQYPLLHVTLVTFPMRTWLDTRSCV